MTDWWAHRFSSVLLLALVFAPACARASSSFATVTTCGARIDVEFRGVPTTRAFTRGGGGGETESVSRNDLLNWINSAATAVCGYYGEFPTRHFSLLVKVDGRRGVHSGTTFPRGEGFTRISVGPQTTVGDLKQDWMMTHEMIHLAFPSMADSHHWIEEGIATYVEPVARVQAGELPASDMWRNLVRDMPQGEPQPGDRGLDQTHTWGRTYWGGALFCLLADVQIREQTGNRMGLQDALRAILHQSGGITKDWPIERALAVGDKATGTGVLEDLYRQMRDQPHPVDLPSLWKRLGVQSTRDGGIEFAANAPLARVREAITRPETQAAGK
ncbi:MAG: hypothetical protein ABSD96_20105 [Candidatus Korobacteraceae bacterium]